MGNGQWAMGIKPNFFVCPMPHARCPMPHYQFPITNSPLPIPHYQFPITNSLLSQIYLYNL
ncbi:MAG: hypothetical protein KME31_18900 [Tolypothrix carrinoi HA7290-LM1]|nr:hypothetical protein [Tolypothrix carrinoi HA7290-LM1]